MKALGYIFGVLLVLTAIALAATVAYYSIHIIKAIIDGAQQLQPKIYVPLVVTVLTASLGLAATLYAQFLTRRREVEAAHRERKIEIYLQFMNILEQLYLSNSENLEIRPIDENETARKLIGIRTKAVLWGSPGVLRALSKFGKSSNTLKAISENLEEIQREMRKDLGLSNSGLEKGFFAKLPIGDPDEYDRLTAEDLG